ncbi:DUF6588 family protein [Mucilaginibacter sp. AW1-3]
MKKIFTLILFTAFVSFKASAQNDDISGIFKGNSDDVNKLLNAYTLPLFKGFGNSLNGGWANTASTQKFLHFDIRISASASLVPQSDKTFDIAALGLSSSVKATDPNKTITPTFGGDTGNGQSITVSDPAHPNDPNYQYKTTLPGGVISYIPAPQLQLTIGLIKNTDVSLRLIPTTKLGDDFGSVGSFGIGFKHNIAQDFGTASHLVPFDLAIAVGYTKLTYNKPMDVKPDANNGGVSGNTDFSNQTLEGNFSGWNAQVILSKKLLFFTPFVSVGYSTSSTDVGFKGNYPFVTGVAVGTAGNGKPIYTSVHDPITINGSAAGTSSMRADIGFKLSLSFFKIYASYSFAEYQSANAGIGLGF